VVADTAQENVGNAKARPWMIAQRRAESLEAKPQLVVSPDDADSISSCQ